MQDNPLNNPLNNSRNGTASQVPFVLPNGNDLPIPPGHIADSGSSGSGGQIRFFSQSSNSSAQSLGNPPLRREEVISQKSGNSGNSSASDLMRVDAVDVLMGSQVGDSVAAIQASHFDSLREQASDGVLSDGRGGDDSNNGAMMGSGGIFSRASSESNNISASLGLDGSGSPLSGHLGDGYFVNTSGYNLALAQEANSNVESASPEPSFPVSVSNSNPPGNAMPENPSHPHEDVVTAVAGRAEFLEQDNNKTTESGDPNLQEATQSSWWCCC